MRRALLSFSLLLPLAACDETSLMGRELPGLGDMYAPSKEEKAEESWWKGFYGVKDENTDDNWWKGFYGTKKAKGAGE